MSWRPDQLVALAARSAGEEELDPGGIELLLGPDWKTQRFQSAINNDGSPLQVCVSLREGGTVVRLLGEPVAYDTDPRSRALEGIRHAYRLARTAGDPSGRARLHAMVSSILPPPLEYRRLHRGALWLGCGVPPGPGFAAYATTAWEPEARRPERVMAWLANDLARPAEALKRVASTSQYGPIAAVGIEGHASRDIRRKVYWYLRKGTDPFGPGILPRDPFEPFLESVLRRHRLAADGVLVSMTFDDVGRFHGCKLDLCGHCMQQPRTAWRTLLDGLSHQFGLATMPCSALEEAPTSVEPAFMSLAMEGERHRVNLYLKDPQSHEDPATSRH